MLKHYPWCLVLNFFLFQFILIIFSPSQIRRVFLSQPVFPQTRTQAQYTESTLSTSPTGAGPRQPEDKYRGTEWIIRFVWRRFEQYCSFIMACIPVVGLFTDVYHLGETHEHGYVAIINGNIIRRIWDSNPRPQASGTPKRRNFEQLMNAPYTTV